MRFLERAQEPEPRRSPPFSPSQPGRATRNKTGSRKMCSRNLFCKAPSLLPQIHAVPSGQPSPHWLQGFTDTPGMKSTTASGKRGAKVSQEFNLCLFSCTSKAFLVLLFKASRHSRNPSCCWGSAHGDPVDWAFQPFLQSAPCSDTQQERNPFSGEPTPAVPFKRLRWFLAEEQQGASSLLTPTTCGTPAASSATPEKQRKNPTAPRPFPECRTPCSHLAGCKWLGTLREAGKEMTYYCLLFRSANREAFIADGTHGNVAQNGEKENTAGKMYVHQTRSEEAKCPCFPEDSLVSSHMVTPHMNMSS